MGFKANTKMKSTEMSVDEAGKGMKKGGMPMVMKDGKKIPVFAAKKGGMPKMNMGGAMMPYGNPSMGMKSGGKTKKMAMGGGAMMANPRITGATAPMLAAQMAQQQGRAALMQPRAIARPNPGMPSMGRKKGGMAEGGESKADMKMDKAQDKAMIKKAFKEHDAQEHKGGKGTTLKLKHGGMHMMPNGKAMKDSAMKKGGMPKHATGGVVQKYATGGVVQKYKEGGHVAMACKDGGGFKANKKGGCF